MVSPTPNFYPFKLISRLEPEINLFNEEILQLKQLNSNLLAFLDQKKMSYKHLLKITQYLDEINSFASNFNKNHPTLTAFLPRIKSIDEMFSHIYQEQTLLQDAILKLDRYGSFDKRAYQYSLEKHYIHMYHLNGPNIQKFADSFPQFIDDFFDPENEKLLALNQSYQKLGESIKMNVWMSSVLVPNLPPEIDPNENFGKYIKKLRKDCLPLEKINKLSTIATRCKQSLMDLNLEEIPENLKIKTRDFYKKSDNLNKFNRIGRIIQDLREIKDWLQKDSSSNVKSDNVK